jgi:hypothetical protein
MARNTKVVTRLTFELRRNSSSTFPSSSSLRMRLPCEHVLCTGRVLVLINRLCGGLTVYAPMIRNGAGPGKKIGVVGLGGL